MGTSIQLRLYASAKTADESKDQCAHFIRVEAFRQNQKLHYSQHQAEVYIER